MLSKDQLEVVSHAKGHAKVTAVAGAGKTTTMIELVLEKMRGGMDGSKIRVIMFNKSAQEDFTSRLTSKCNAAGIHKTPSVKTFHAIGRSLCEHFIRQGWMPRLNLEPLPDHELNVRALSALKACATPDIQKLIKEKQNAWLRSFLEFVDICKSCTLSPENVFIKHHYPPEKTLFIKAYHHFETWRIKEGKCTYADYLYQPVIAMQCSKHALRSVTNKIELIIVDEFQDVSEIQFEMLKMLAGSRAMVVVVGDGDQCIYEFRGAKPVFMTSGFSEAFEHASYKIPRTYRYGHCLAISAAHLISNNKDRDDVLCISGDGSPSTKISCHDQSLDCRQIVGVYKERISQGFKPESMVVLCRLWSQSTPVELSFLKHGIRYRMSGGYSALDRSEIRALITVLLMNSEHWANIPSTERATKVFELLKMCGLMVKHEELRRIGAKIAHETNTRASELILLEADAMGEFRATRMRDLGKTLQYVETAETASEALERFSLGLDYITVLREGALKPEDGDNRANGARCFIDFIMHDDKRTINESIEYINSLNNSKTNSPSNGSIEITTMHRSKGLEWDCVFIPGMSSDNVPYLKEVDGGGIQNTIEAERRLMYVAMTRAKVTLDVFAPGINGSGGSDVELKDSEVPSLFVSEMQIEDSVALGEAIENMTGNISVSADCLLLSRRYLKDIGSTPSIQISKGEEKPKFSIDCQYTSSSGEEILVVGKDPKMIEAVKNDGTTVFYSLYEAERCFSANNKNTKEKLNNKAGDVMEGMRIMHSKFGAGLIEGTPDNYVLVRFSDKTRYFNRDGFLSGIIKT